MFDFTNSALSVGSVPGSFFNEAGVSSTSVLMYGINTHTSGCSGTKCNGINFPDFDIRQIGIESDVEERGGSMKSSAGSLGVYSVCVDCNNSGRPYTSMMSPASPNIAFLAGANTAPGATDDSPWGVAFDSGTGGALMGLILNPTASAASTDAQQIQQCALNAAGSPVCSLLSTTHLSAFTIASPGVTTITNGAGLQSNHYGGLPGAPTTTVTGLGAISTVPTLTGNDSQGTISIPSTIINISTTHNLLTVNFGTGYGSPPVCLVSENGNPYIAVGHLTPAAATLTVTASIGNGTASAYTIDYYCSGT